MTTNGESKFSYLFIGLGLGTIGGLMFALLVQSSARESVSTLAHFGPALIPRKPSRFHLSWAVRMGACRRDRVGGGRNQEIVLVRSPPVVAKMTEDQF